MLGNVVSLFDESGNMVRDWAKAGYSCYCYDILNKGNIEYIGLGSITYNAADLMIYDTHVEIIALKPVIVFGFPPCTDLATLGAKHFESKRERDPFFQVKAVALARVVESIGIQCDCPWFAENPISVLSTLWRKPNYIFSPHEYGGYLPENDVHPRWPQYIMPRDAYTKKTCLWTGNGFQLPPKMPIAPVLVSLKNGKQGSVQWKKLGGKSEKTKQIRSETARGFALAVFKYFHAQFILASLFEE